MTRRPVFKAHDIGELINALPAMFGFPPDDSLVLLGTDGPRITFGMRLDLPDAHRIDAVADLGIRHLEHQRVKGAIVLAIGEPLDVGQRLVSAIEARLVTVRPVAGGWANDERYWVSMDGGDPQGYAYRRSLDHPAAAEAVWAGQEISPSRDVMAGRVLPSTGERRAWIERSAPTAAARFAADVSGLGDDEVQTFAADEFTPVVHDLMADRKVHDGALLRLGFGLTAIAVRDRLWGLVTKENARAMVRVWLHVGRNVPLEWTPAPLCLAAFASWLAGDGALAVIAGERAMQVDPEYPMAGLMLALATSGVSPEVWSGYSQPIEAWLGDDRAAF